MTFLKFTENIRIYEAMYHTHVLETQHIFYKNSIYSDTSWNTNEANQAIHILDQRKLCAMQRQHTSFPDREWQQHNNYCQLVWPSSLLHYSSVSLKYQKMERMKTAFPFSLPFKGNANSFKHTLELQYFYITFQVASQDNWGKKVACKASQNNGPQQKD